MSYRKPVTGDGGQSEDAGDDTDDGVEGRQLAEDCWKKEDIDRCSWRKEDSLQKMAGRSKI